MKNWSSIYERVLEFRLLYNNENNEKEIAYAMMTNRLSIDSVLKLVASSIFTECKAFKNKIKLKQNDKILIA